MYRFLYIVGVLTKYSLLYLLLKLNLYSKPKQKLLRNFFEEAGGSFIKFGQLLAVRVDVLPKEYALEMINLFDNVSPFPYEEVESVFLQQLGATPDKIFKHFQKKPFASASFGQVHGAKLANDHIVAVKILRPGIEEMIAVDFFIVSILAFFSDLFFKIDALPWGEFAKEFKKWTREELDYHIEADRMETIRKTATDDNRVVIPKVYRHLSTKRILVEDYIEGIPLSRVLLGLKDGRLTQESIQKRGIDLKKVTSLMTQEILREFFLGEIFHADPHPGNILILPENKIALIDFGIVGECLKHNKYHFVQFIKATANIDFKKSVYHFANFSGDYLKNMIESALPASSSPKDVDEFMNEISNYFSEEVEKIARLKSKRLQTMKEDYTSAFLEILRAAKKLRVKLPNEAILFIRTLTVAGFLVKQLNYDFKLATETKKFFAEFPEDTWLKDSDKTTPYKRISHERAIEQFNGWLSYLIEVDPSLYQLVNKKLKDYNAIDI